MKIANLLLIIFTISIFVECSFLERMRRHHTHKHKTHHKIKLSHKSSCQIKRMIKYKRIMTRLKLQMDMKFLYTNKLREPLFTKQSAKAIDVMANEIMNSLYTKCLKPGLTDAESFRYTKADDLVADGSEFRAIMDPVENAIKAIQNPEDKTTSFEEFDLFNKQFQPAYESCYEKWLNKKQIDLIEAALKQPDVAKLKEAVQKLDDDSADAKHKITGTDAEVVESLKSFLETRQSQLQKEDAEYDEQILQVFQKQQARKYDVVVTEVFEKAKLPNFCWIQRNFPIKCDKITITVEDYKDLKGQEVKGEKREVRMDPTFTGKCKETCYQYGTNKRFPKCKVMFGRVFTSYCNKDEKKVAMENNALKNCHSVTGSIFNRHTHYHKQAKVPAPTNAAQACGTGLELVKWLGVFPRCKPTIAPTCASIGYTKCMGRDVGCGLRSTNCYDAVKQMVVASIKGITKLALLFLVPGASLILDFLTILNQIITLMTSVADFIISRLRVADNILTMHPVAINVWVKRAAQNLYDYYKATEDPLQNDGKSKTFKQHEAAVADYVNKFKETITESPGVWEQLLMATTGCQFVACPKDTSGLKLCRNCGKENETNFWKNVEKQAKKDAEDYKKIGTQTALEASVQQAKTEITGIQKAGATLWKSLNEGADAKSLLPSDRKSIEDNFKAEYQDEKPPLINQIAQNPAAFGEKMYGTVKSFSISEWVGYLNPGTNTDTALYKIFNVMQIGQYLELWNIKGAIQSYMTNDAKSIQTDELYKNNKKKAIVKQMLSFANNFDPTGISGIVSAFIHDDCPQFAPFDPDQENQETAVKENVIAAFVWAKNTGVNSGTANENPVE